MVSMKMKMKKPSFKIGGKKKAAAKEEDIKIEPTVERAPEAEDDPIMEDREDRPPSPAEEKADERSPAEDAPRDADESVATEVLSTVKEEPSKEEAEDVVVQEVEETPNGCPSINVKTMDTLDEDLTLDNTADAEGHGCSDAAEIGPAFCGCLADLLK